MMPGYTYLIFMSVLFQFKKVKTSFVVVVGKWKKVKNTNKKDIAKKNQNSLFSLYSFITCHLVLVDISHTYAFASDLVHLG